MDEFSTIFIYFSGYSFIGWVCETIYCSFLFKKVTNRGFLNGPFCPVYGFGALILLQILQNIPRNMPLIFIAGTLITTAIEYFTGYILEKLFHAKWWDYSQNKFNFRGRICLLNSIVFGISSVVLIFAFHPLAAHFVLLVKPDIRLFIMDGLLIYFAADMIITVKSMRSLNLRLEAISKALAAAKEKLDVSGFYNALGISQRLERLHELLETDRGRSIYASIENAGEHIRQLINDNRLSQSRMIKAFPTLRSTRYPEVLSMIKEKILHTRKDNSDVNTENTGAEKSDRVMRIRS